MRRSGTPIPTTTHTDTTSPVAVWVVAALGVHLFVSSLAIASSACSGTIERTRVARISGPVVQVLRELVESTDHARREIPIEHDDIDVPRAIAPLDAARTTRTRMLDARLIDLPPPTVA